MKKQIFGIIVGLFLVAVNCFAANGDFLVDGNLGVGTASPGLRLDVVESANKISGRIKNTNTLAYQSWGLFYLSRALSTVGSGGALHFTFNNASGTDIEYAGIGGVINTNTTGSEAGDLVFYTTNNGATRRERVRILASGNVGIGTVTPAYLLQLATDSAAKPSTSTWAVASDSRLKTNIQPYTKGLKEILQINPVTYQYNGKGGVGHNIVKTKDPVTGNEIGTDVVDTALLSKTNVGVIAQDIQAVVPETVTSHKGKIDENDTIETDILDFNSHALTFILVNAIKDLKSQIDSLNQQIADLRAKLK